MDGSRPFRVVAVDTDLQHFYLPLNSTDFGLEGINGLGFKVYATLANALVCWVVHGMAQPVFVVALLESLHGHVPRGSLCALRL